VYPRCVACFTTGDTELGPTREPEGPERKEKMLGLMWALLLSSRALRAGIAPRGHAPQAGGGRLLWLLPSAPRASSRGLPASRVFSRAPRVRYHYARRTHSVNQRPALPIIMHTYICIRTYAYVRTRYVLPCWTG